MSILRNPTRWPLREMCWIQGGQLKRFITGAEHAYMLTVWSLLAVMLVLVLPLNLIGKLLDKGSEAVTLWAAEIQAIAVAKMKE